MKELKLPYIASYLVELRTRDELITETIEHTEPDEIQLSKEQSIEKSTLESSDSGELYLKDNSGYETRSSEGTDPDTISLTRKPDGQQTFTLEETDPDEIIFMSEERITKSIEVSEPDEYTIY